MAATMIGRAELEEAILRRQIALVYQPMIHLASGLCVGAEALVRWHKEDGRVLSPDDFIPLAERLQCTDLITRCVVDLVIAELGECLSAQPGVHVAINICAHELNNEQLFLMTRRKLERSGIDPRQLWLEITESVCVETTAARHCLSTARQNGHLVVIDDFGTGYSNLRYLRELPCDVLKIDRSFIGDASGGKALHPFLDFIISLARSLQLTMVAEGVETPEQAHYLREAGVHYAQGWYFAKAMPWAAFVDYLRRHS